MVGSDRAYPVGVERLQPFRGNLRLWFRGLLRTACEPVQDPRLGAHAADIVPDERERGLAARVVVIGVRRGFVRRVEIVGGRAAAGIRRFCTAVVVVEIGEIILWEIVVIQFLNRVRGGGVRGGFRIQCRGGIGGGGRNIPFRIVLRAVAAAFFAFGPVFRAFGTARTAFMPVVFVGFR